MVSTFQRDRFTWLAYLLLAFYGYFLNVLGPITPFLKDELKLSYTISSFHFTAFAVGILLIGLGGHWVIERIGRIRSLWLGALGMSTSVVLLLLGSTPIVTISASFLMGLIGSLILAIVPSALSDRHGEQRAIAFSEANVIASLVSTAAPLMVGWFAQTSGGWRLGLAVVACAPIVMRFGFGTVQPPIAKPSISNDSTNHSLPTLFWVYWVALVLAVSVEFCMISWSADYLENGLGMLKVDAAQAVSLFLGAMIVGRWIASKLVQHLATHRVVIGYIVLASTGFLMYWLAGNALMGQAGLFVTGLGVAGLYPLILSLAIGTAGSKTIQASARTTLASGCAILALPLVLGRLADWIGIRPAYGIVIVLLVSVLAIIHFTPRHTPAPQIAVSE